MTIILRWADKRQGHQENIYVEREGGREGWDGAAHRLLLIYIRNALQLGLAGFWPQVEFWQLNSIR